MIGAMLDLGEGRRESFVPLVAAWLARRGVDQRVGTIEVVEVEVLSAGRPGLLDVVARVDGRIAHLVLGLHMPWVRARRCCAAPTTACSASSRTNGALRWRSTPFGTPN